MAALPARRLLGLMAGTSLDGVDAALVWCTGRGLRTQVTVEAWRTTPYPPALRDRLAAACAGACPPSELARLHWEMGEAFAAAALGLLRAQRVAPTRLTAIASHGQTVAHHSRRGAGMGATLQIGEGAVIAARTGVLTLCDFRPADIATGGEGAPLIPYADYVLLHSPRRTRVVQNIGGIANLTFLPRRGGLEAVLAFDTGPGNLMMDAAMQTVTHGRQALDRDGAFAAQGRVSRRLLSSLLAHPFLRRRPPKSADREDFGGAFFRQTLQRAQRLRVSEADLVATLTAFTAESIVDSYRRFLPAAEPPDEVILGGGGAQNLTLVRALAARLPGVALLTHEQVGWPSKAKEAIAFAVLGDATLQGRTANVPGATGGGPALLGKVCYPPPAAVRRGRRRAGRAGEPPDREHRG